MTVPLAWCIVLGVALFVIGAAGLLLRAPVDRPDTAITVADLTGVGALDAALASAVLGRLTG